MGEAAPPCLDCGEPLTVAPFAAAYNGAGFSSCYLCPFCRTHRYKSEAHALARVRAGFQKREAVTHGN
jgi:hypothetical protein